MTTSSVVEDIKELALLYAAGGNVKWNTHFEKIWQFLKKLNIHQSYDLATALLHIYPKEMVCPYEDICIQMSTTALFVPNMSTAWRLGWGGIMKGHEDPLGSHVHGHCLDCGFQGCMHLSKLIKLYALNMCIYYVIYTSTKLLKKIYAQIKKIQTEQQSNKHDLQTQCIISFFLLTNETLCIDQ